MKKSIIFILLLCFTGIQMSFSQVKFGIKIGVSAPSGQFGSINVKDSLSIKLKDVKSGLSGGFWLRAGNKIFLQPELYFNSNTNAYSVNGSGWNDVIKSEKYQYLDMPVLVGLKLGPLSLQGGPVGHYFISSKSELTDIATYTQNFDRFTFGYQAGGGLDFAHLGLDIRYQGNFKNKDGHMNFFGTQYQFDKSPATVVIALRYKF